MLNMTEPVADSDNYFHIMSMQKKEWDLVTGSGWL